MKAATRRIAITGAGGQLGRQLVAELRAAGHEILALSHVGFDIADRSAQRSLARWHPDIVVNAAAWTDVDGCAADPQRAVRINGQAPGRLAAAVPDALFLQISTNEVFSGASEHAYGEGDQTTPVSSYGRSKLAGEIAVREAARRFVLVRTAWLFGPGGNNFVTKISSAASRANAEHVPLRVVDDEFGNPTWTPHLAQAIVKLLDMAEPLPPVLHLAGTPACSRYEWASHIVRIASIPVEIEAINSSEFTRKSVPPRHAVLSTDLAAQMGLPELGWQKPLAEYLGDLLSGQ